MGNFFSELYKGLRSVGMGFRDGRRAVREERNAQRTERAFAEQFGVSFESLVQRVVEPRIERTVVDILARHLPTLLPRALPEVLWRLSQDSPALGAPAEGESEGEDDPGTLVACLSRSNGAYWGNAPEGGGNYGFKVWIGGDKSKKNRVHVSAGTAQFWGGKVKTYDEAELGQAANGKYVYAVLNLSDGWNSALSYGNMTGQNADKEVWVPIARISGNANDGFAVTQLHGGNIVIPAVTNAVDVQAK